MYQNPYYVPGVHPAVVAQMRQQQQMYGQQQGAAPYPQQQPQQRPTQGGGNPAQRAVSMARAGRGLYNAGERIGSMLGYGDAANTATTAGMTHANPALQQAMSGMSQGSSGMSLMSGGEITAPAQQVASSGGSGSGWLTVGGEGGGTPSFSVGQPSTAGYLAAAAQAVRAGQALKNRDRSTTDTAQDFAQNAALAVANIYTGGLAGLGHGLLMKTGTGRKIDAGIKKFDKKLGWLSPTKQLSTAMNAMGIAQKSTKAHQQDRIKHLLGQNLTGYEDFVNKTQQDVEGYNKEYADRIGNSAGFRTDLADDFVGYEPTGRWQNNLYAKSGDVNHLRPEDAWGSVGAFRTFGNDWLGNYSEDQRRQITQGMLDRGLFYSDKGDLLVRDPNAAMQVRDEILGGTQ